MKADFQNKEDDWQYLETGQGYQWWNYSTGEVEYGFWKGLFKKLKIIK